MFLRTMALITLALTGADHWTTYLCLREPVAGWSVVEANPAVGLLFEAAGLLGGLAIDSLITITAIAFLLVSTRFATRTKRGFLTVIAVTTAFAVINNLQAISELGISPLGLG